MKTVKSTKQPSYKDALPNGDRVYYCPVCEQKGYAIPSSELAPVYCGLIVKNGRVNLSGRRTGKAACIQCGALFKLVGSEVILIG